MGSTRSYPLRLDANLRRWYQSFENVKSGIDTEITEEVKEFWRRKWARITPTVFPKPEDK